MPTVGVTLTSIHNPHVKYARSLHVRKNRQRERAFIVEGTRLFLDALAAGARPIRVFFEPERAEEPVRAVLQELADGGVRIHPATVPVIDAISDTQTPQGIVAVFAFPTIAINFDGQTPLLVVADGIRDPGNLGSLIRITLGAGAHALYVSPGTVDPYSPKVVRAAMGAHFRLPVERVDWHEPPTDLLSCTQRIAAEANGVVCYDKLDWTVASALIIGSEATGISEISRKYVTSSVSIPLHGGLESLNAAVAGAVILFEASRQRRTQ